MIKIIKNNLMYKTSEYNYYIKNGMKTSYDIDLPFSQEITGTAEIITEDYIYCNVYFFRLNH